MTIEISFLPENLKEASEQEKNFTYVVSKIQHLLCTHQNYLSFYLSLIHIKVNFPQPKNPINFSILLLPLRLKFSIKSLPNISQHQASQIFLSEFFFQKAREIVSFDPKDQ